MYRVELNQSLSRGFEGSFAELELFVERLMCRDDVDRLDVWSMEERGEWRHLGTLEAIRVEAPATACRVGVA